MNSDRTDQETGTSATDAVELTSWKEIAHYLGVHVRTAQKWVHTLRLPVHRRAGARSRVFAYTAELDAWKRQGLRASPQERHYSWPLGSGVTVEVRFTGAPLERRNIELLRAYLNLLKNALS